MLAFILHMFFSWKKPSLGLVTVQKEHKKQARATTSSAHSQPVHLSQKHCESVFHRCYRILRDRELAYDATQETLTRFMEMCQKKTLHKPLNYLYRMSTNCCLDVLAHYKKHIPLESSLEYGAHLVTPSVESKLLLEQLFSEFGREQIDLLIYRYIDRMTYQEIAELYGKSDRGIKKRMDKLEQQIHRYLRE